jgi:multisubunit Na+/H+ antiporter MnhB subunit
MNPIIEICLDTTAILTIVCGVAGLIFSLSLIFFPERTRAIDEFLSRSYHLKERLAYFDQTIRNELFIYRHPMVWGALLMLGSIVTLIFLFVQMDVERLVGVLPIQENHRLPWEMVLEVFVLTGKLAGVIGVIVGLFLMIAPGRLQRIEKRLNSWIATQPLVDRLDVFNHVVNIFSFRHPMLIGSIGVLLSTILIALSLSNFF